MSVETVKLLYNDVDNSRFTSSQYSSFKTSGINYLYTLRPDLFINSSSLALKANAAGMCQADIPAGSSYVKFLGIVKGTATKSPRLVDFPEALAKNPTWGRELGTDLEDISEYCVDTVDNTTCLYFDKFVDGATAKVQVTTPSTLQFSSAWVDEALDKYMLYMCYSADSTSQQDQAIAQQYLQEFKSMVMTQRPAAQQDKTPYPMKTVAMQQPQGGRQ